MTFDMSGKKYGRLTVIDQYYKISGNGKTRDYCLCQCDCYRNPPKEYLGKNIRRGMTTSCGCYHLEQVIKKCKKYNRYDLDNDYGICYYFNSNNFFYFDLKDFDKVKDFCWHETSHGYAYSNMPMDGECFSFQDLVMNNLDNHTRIDHINRIRNDNRKINLREVTHQQNNINRSLSSKNTSGIMGVSKTKDNFWHSYLGINGHRILNKRFKHFNEAVIARLDAEKEHFGEFAPQKHLFKQYGIE